MKHAKLLLFVLAAGVLLAGCAAAGGGATDTAGAYFVFESYEEAVQASEVTVRATALEGARQSGEYLLTSFAVVETIRGEMPKGEFVLRQHAPGYGDSRVHSSAAVVGFAAGGEYVLCLDKVGRHYQLPTPYGAAYTDGGDGEPEPVLALPG